MNRASLVTLGLINGVLSALLFAGATAGLALLFGDARAIAAAPTIFAASLGVTGPVIIVLSLVAAMAGSLAKKSAHASHLVAMIVAGCLGLFFLRSGIAPGMRGALTPTHLLLVAALVLPWAASAGYLKAFRKPA